MKILLSGCTGNMGKTITEICNESEQYSIVCGFGLKDESLKDNNLKNNQIFTYPVFDDLKDPELEKIVNDVDVILDFSYFGNLEALLELAEKANKPIVLATTGYSGEQIEKIKLASKNIPIFYSRNMSLGINALSEIAKYLSSKLIGFDIEIIEKHHKLKKDSPSGTAKMLFEAVSDGRENNLHEIDGRSGLSLIRDEKEVGIHAVRGGTIVGEHSIIFAGVDEIIEITHKANSKKVFALGSLKACLYLSTCPPGLYDMNNILKVGEN